MKNDIASENKLAPGSETERKELVRKALNVTRDTFASPGPYEQTLLDSYIHGQLTIDEVITLLCDYEGSNRL